MTVIADQLKRARFRAVTYLSKRPGLYYGIPRLGGCLDGQCVRCDTDIVIEGYLRSANSTTVHRFLERQTRALPVAHHKHHAAQILRAVEFGLPAVVLIRNPRAACLSLLALAAKARQRANRASNVDLTFANGLDAYIAFYEAVESHLDHVVIGRFEAIRSDVADLIQRVNKHFCTSFQVERTKTTPQPELGWLAMLNPLRNGIKRKLEARFDTALEESPVLRQFLSRAEAIHVRYYEVDNHAR